MEKLKSFAWFAAKVALAVIVIEIVDAKTGIISKIRSWAGGIAGA